MNSNNKTTVVGRYAPSPSGDLHLGNLRTALLSWLQVRLQEGKFLMRIEDLDTPRVVAGSAEQNLTDLEWLGLDWDGELVYQSTRQDLYADALAKLTAKELIYPCFCSRKEIHNAVSAPHGTTPVYPGMCSQLTAVERNSKADKKKPALRVSVKDTEIEFEDGIVGKQHQNLQQDCGDFVVKRADGLFAYQLAVVVDDAEQGVTDVMRGADLIDSTARQLYLFDQLELPRPAFWHVPLMYDEAGARMAKRFGSCSAIQWQQQGKNQTELVAMLAASVGLIEKIEAISCSDLLAELNYKQFVEALRISSENQIASTD